MNQPEGGRPQSEPSQAAPQSQPTHAVQRTEPVQAVGWAPPVQMVQPVQAMNELPSIPLGVRDRNYWYGGGLPVWPTNPLSRRMRGSIPSLRRR